jgi:hypothetical protein
MQRIGRLRYHIESFDRREQEQKQAIFNHSDIGTCNLAAARPS